MGTCLNWLHRKRFQFGMWLIQQSKPMVYGIWMVVPPGYSFSTVHKQSIPGACDPLDMYESIGIKLQPKMGD